MSCRFMDSFDHYATASILEKWTSSAIAPAISAGNGRRGGQSVRISGANSHLTKTLDAQASWVVGFAFRTSSLPAVNTILSFLDAGTSQCELRLNIDGTLSVTRNGSAVTGGTSVAALATGTYYYIEMKVTIADSIGAGSCKVRINGVDAITVTAGQDLKNTANATANQIRLGQLAGAGQITGDWDDLYVLDGVDSGISGNPCNDFLGDVAVAPFYATGAGATTAWSPDSGSNYARVNEALADGDTSYVETGAAGNIDTYAFQNLSGAPASIFAVGWNGEMRKTDASTYKVRSVFHDSTDHVSSVDQSLGTTYSIFQEIFHAKPGTSSQWVYTDLNSSPQFGAKLNSVV